MRPFSPRRPPRLASVTPVVVLGLALLTPAWAQPPQAQPLSREERKRQQLLRQLNLPTAPPAPSTAPPAPTQNPIEKPAPPPSQAGEGPTGAILQTPPPPAFAGRLHETLLASCRGCHSTSGAAASSRFRLDGDLSRDFGSTRTMIDLHAPRRSLLLTKALGEAHGGGLVLSASTDGFRRILRWISAGGLRESSTPDGVGSAAEPSGGASPPHRSSHPKAPPAKPQALAAGTLPKGATNPLEVPDAKIVVTAPDAAPRENVPLVPPPGRALHSELVRSCMPCHGPGGMAAQTRYRLSGDLGENLAITRLFVDLHTPNASPALTKARGEAHGGGVVWAPGSEGAVKLLSWIAAGTPDDLTAAPPDTPVTSDLTKVEAPPQAIPSGPPPRAVHGAGAPANGLDLAGGFHLNGRFDLNVDRRNFQTNPLSGKGDTALQSYHHFLFLNRSSVDDPFTLDVEIIDLEFFEIGARLLGPRSPIGIHVKAGKIVVPFGTEPLFHQSYGGHAGFDQRVLPAIWASEGVSASANTRVHGLALTLDAFSVRGHHLRGPDVVLNLQADRSPADDVHLGSGLRLGAAWGPIGGFYSNYWNPLGAGRTLFMQALDAGIWRWRRFPVLDRVVLGIGVLRADVSGSGGGQDYYHFASYLQARVYAFDWLHLQYRQGLRTFDNRRGLYQDPRRFGSSGSLVDGSTHNVGVVARYAGLQAGLTYFLNFEKTNETPDDLLRLMVAYEF